MSSFLRRKKKSLNISVIFDWKGLREREREREREKERRWYPVKTIHKQTHCYLVQEKEGGWKLPLVLSLH